MRVIVKIKCFNLFVLTYYGETYRMPNILKSKLGMFIAGIYLLAILYAIFETNGSRPHSMDGLALLILTAPFSFLLALLFESLGIMTKENGDSLLYIYVAFGGLINASILYLIGCLFTKIWAFFSSGKKSLTDA